MTTDEHSHESAIDERADDSVEIEILNPTPEGLGLNLPEDPDAAQIALLNALADSRAEAGQNLEQLQRIAAEYENFRRRTERDRRDLATFATSRLVEQLLPTLDSLEAALAYDAQTEGEEKLLTGMTGTHTMLSEMLSSYGFAAIDSAGCVFDPAIHEAISGPGDGDGTLMVDQELRKGYTVEGRVVRPALVTVAYGDAGEDGGGDDDA